MRSLVSKLYILIKLRKDERGQDLIEYALVVALIALAATTGMNTLASGINGAFTSIAGSLSNAI